MLQRLRQNKYMARLAHFSGPSRRRSGARFSYRLGSGHVTADNKCLRRAFHGLFKGVTRRGPATSWSYSRSLRDYPRRRHSALCPGGAGYSAEQVGDTVRQLGMFAGSAGLQACTPDDEGFQRMADRRPACLDEAPFMVPLLFLLVSRQFSVLAVAECLSRARFGFWPEDRRTFFPELSPASAFGFAGGCRLRRCGIWGWWLSLL